MIYGFMDENGDDDDDVEDIDYEDDDDVVQNQFSCDQSTRHYVTPQRPTLVTLELRVASIKPHQDSRSS